MTTSNKRLDYRQVQAQYQEKFGRLPPSQLLKSVSLMDGGTQDLAKAMQATIQAGQPLNFKQFASQFFEHLVEAHKANE